MRGSTRHGSLSAVRPGAFGWDPALVATLSHVSLPWDEDLPLVAFSDAAAVGRRDAVSLLAQFAAHQAFLQFGGIADGDFRAEEWAVVRRRGTDVRLVRTGASSCDPLAAAPPIVAIQQFADAVGASLDVLQRAWARPDSVYAEAFAQVTRAAAADLRWVRLSACGRLLAPGADALRALVEHPGRHSYSHPSVVDALLRYASLVPEIRVVVLRGTSPLERYSALRPLVDDPGLPPAAVAEAISAAETNTIFVITAEEAFDEPSRTVATILSKGAVGTWLVPGTDDPLPGVRPFVIAPSLTAGERLRGAVAPEAFETFVTNDAFDAYVLHGDIPPASSRLPALQEPARSYLGALALLGPRCSSEVARRFLAEFLFTGSLDELLVPGVLRAEEDSLVFESEQARSEAMSLIPLSSRPTICRVAASHRQDAGAATLWLDAGEPDRAVELLEAVTWSGPEQTVAELRQIPPTVLSPSLANRLAHALVDCGRYQEACDVARGDGFVLARVDRRRGNYDAALTRLERLGDSFDVLLLRAELLRLVDRDGEARETLARCEARSDSERARLAYERALHGMDAEIADGYLALRLAAYRAGDRGDFTEMARLAEEAHRRAGCATERIDASLDRLFAAFTGGRWNEARISAVESLREVEETEGDRAAGGILYILAFLAADEGRWGLAARTIERLRRFYTSTRDPIRLAELDLLRAHLDFSRGRFDEAFAAAKRVFEQRSRHDQMREAAALILDEIDAMRGPVRALRSTGGAGNIELARRHRDLKERAADPSRHRPGDRVSDGDGGVPARLACFRAAVARRDERTAAAIARELDLVYEPAPSEVEAELRLLRAAAVREFPFAPHDLEGRWCFSTRNRLGQWTSIGSVTPESDPSLSVRTGPDWIACSEREMLWIEGSSRWTDPGREAIAALFAARSEAWRLRRLIDQEENARSAAPAPLDGMLGRSAAIREVESLAARVAARDVAICILGESGTGKELVARSIHRNSRRRQKTFTPVNCAALPENLVESELFGHVRGAFTGADRDRAGLIEITDGGTLFLDEIGELPLPAQAKLLRFLQEGEFRRVGEATNRTADVRIVSATNRRLETAVEEGTFREDLYYRIRGVELQLPPLRDRGGDVMLLAEAFLRAERERHRSGPAAFSSDVEAIFSAYRWPGNVRELQNTVRAAHAVAGEARQVELEHLPERLRKVAPARVAAGSYQDAVARFKRELIERSLAEAGGNQNRAASLLKMSRQALAYQIRELGILVRL